MLVLLPLLLLLPLLYYYLTRSHNYWKNRDVPYFPALPVIGTLKKLMWLEESPGEFLGNLYSSPEAQNERFMGMFIFNSEPAILLRDPELIKQIFVKDFQYFNNRNVWTDQHNDPIGFNNLFVIRDEKWKYLRAKLSPTFTSGKIKQMFKLITEVADELLKNIDGQIDNNNVFEIKELAAKYTTDVISTCAFGIQSNSLNDENATFREFGRMIFHMTPRRALEVRAFFFMHWLAKAFNAIFLQKESCKFFKKVFWEAMDVRQQEGISRNDFLDTLIHLKNEAAAKLKENPDRKELFDFDGDSLVAQSVLFFTAGFETTASTISFTLIELAFAPQIQQQLREEINQNFEQHDGRVTYEGLFEMKLLDRVISEVLRKYPPMPFIDRLCTQDYKVPDSDLVIEAGTPLFVSMYGGLHYDPQYFPDPHKFDPDRFTEENKAKRHPSSYIPFGEGPHICIGMRFALMNVKTAISLIIKKYKVEPIPGFKMPLEVDHRAVIHTVQGGIPVRLTRIQQ